MAAVFMTRVPRSRGAGTSRTIRNQDVVNLFELGAQQTIKAILKADVTALPREKPRKGPRNDLAYGGIGGSRMLTQLLSDYLGNLDGHSHRRARHDHWPFDSLSFSHVPIGLTPRQGELLA